MSESSEEKSLPPTDKKLRDARRKGQVARSQDLVSGVVLLLCSVYLAWRIPYLLARIEALFDSAASIYEGPMDDAAVRLATDALTLCAEILWPLLLLTVTAVIASSVIAMGGFVLSTEPIKPKLEHIDPVAGFKRIFSMRSIVEFSKSLFKCIALAAALIGVYRWRLAEIVNAAQCGMDCVASTTRHLLVPLVLITVIAILVTGLFDLKLQSWLFRRDMRMTHSETKRERKDTEGNPEIRRERNRQRRDNRVHVRERGIRHATLVLVSDAWVIGLRYTRGVTPAPIVVVREPAAAAADTLAQASGLGIPVMPAADLADAIARGARIGIGIPAHCFQPVANLLVQARLL
jgi:type III secretion protein U